MFHNKPIQQEEALVLFASLQEPRKYHARTVNYNRSFYACKLIFCRVNVSGSPEKKQKKNQIYMLTAASAHLKTE